MRNSIVESDIKRLGWEAFPDADMLILDYGDAYFGKDGGTHYCTASLYIWTHPVQSIKADDLDGIRKALQAKIDAAKAALQ
jgi:hypothetical protein